MTSNRWGWHDLPLGPFPGTGPEDHPGHPADGTWLESPLNSLMTMDLLKNGPHTHNWSTGSWNVWATTIALEPMGLDWALGMRGPFVFFGFLGHYLCTRIIHAATAEVNLSVHTQCLLLQWWRCSSRPGLNIMGFHPSTRPKILKNMSVLISGFSCLINPRFL